MPLQLAIHSVECFIGGSGGVEKCLRPSALQLRSEQARSGPAIFKGEPNSVDNR
jgi:hypothetical protein